MNQLQAEQLIAEYNAVEQEQTVRLRALYDFVKSRKGYRAVKFASHIWSNCWGGDLSLDNLHSIHVDGMAQPVIELIPGIE